MTHNDPNDKLHPELKSQVDSLPREIQPRRDLWQSIEAAISDNKIVRPDFQTSASTAVAEAAAAPSMNWRRLGLLAAAAMLLVAFSSGITAYLVRTPAATPVGIVEPPRAAFETVAWQGFLEAEGSYKEVTDDLLAQLDAQRDTLRPETVEIVEENLRLIDGAIANARAALEQDPANARLVNKLTNMYRSKVSFLESMSRL
jgi:hypothetical protein